MRSLLPILAMCLSLGAWAQEPRDRNWPDGYRLVCRLEPAAEVARAERRGVLLRRVSGRPVHLDTPEDGPYPVVSHTDSVTFLVSRLKKNPPYVFGLEWWDGDGKGRRQSVAFNATDADTWTQVLPATPPVAFHADKSTFARILLPVPDDVAKAGKFSVRFRNEYGPDAVVGDVWILERVDPPKEQRVLIVTCDDWRGHLWRKTAPELAELLREDPRFEVSITESPAILGSPLLDHYNVVLLHFKNYPERLSFDESVHHGLRNFVDSGGGLVVAHFGCGAFQEWDGMVKTIGRVWNPEFRAHDEYGPFKVHIADAQHPITRTMKNFTTEDELYSCLDGEEAIHVVCDAVSKVDGKTYPMGLVPANGTGSVFLCTLGHDVNSFQAEGTRTLYRRAVAWAAGLEP